MKQLRSGIVVLALAAAAIINLMPAAGILGAATLERLYGLPVDTPELALLLRHRAVLFLLLGLGLLGALRWPAWRLPMLVAALASMASFMALAGTHGVTLPAALARVWWVDALVLPWVVVAIGLLWHEQRARTCRVTVHPPQSPAL